MAAGSNQDFDQNTSVSHWDYVSFVF